MNAIHHTSREQTPMSISENADSTLQHVANALEALNQAVADAVEAGMTVEIKRTCRYHGHGAWGDQMSPVVVQSRS